MIKFCLSFRPSLRLSLCQSVHLSVCLSLSVCLLASYTDILWARHAIFLPHVRGGGRLRDEPKECLRRRLVSDQFKPIRIRENLVVKYKKEKNGLTLAYFPRGRNGGTQTISSSSSSWVEGTKHVRCLVLKQRV